MAQHHAVLGLHFGDEGKGTTVDFLVKHYNANLVVRFNGGPQAAHHVVTDAGKVHCFAQFGAGTLQREVKTLLSHFMLVDIRALRVEAEFLATRHAIEDAAKRVLIDRRCPLVTPLHKMIGRMREIARGRDKHGSTGRGVGVAATEAAAEANGAPVATVLRAEDLVAPLPALRRKLVSHLVEKLKEARSIIAGSKDAGVGEAAMEELVELRTSTEKAVTLQWLERDIAEFVAEYGTSIVDGAALLAEALAAGPPVVFEGAQGALLDPVVGTVPYVTKTRCTFDQAEQLIEQAQHLPRGEGRRHITRWGVVRSYSHRHGAGPLVGEFPDDVAARVGVLSRESHNAETKWQGPFRAGWLDIPGVQLVKYAASVVGGVDCLALTHCDLLRDNGDDGELSRAVVAYTVEETQGVEGTVAPWFQRDGDGHVIGIRASDGEDVQRVSLGVALRACRPARWETVQRAEGGEGAVQGVVALLQREIGVEVALMSYGPAAKDKRLTDHAASKE